ncbi:PstS family phosphate ABC transporter substrate-binding protein [Aridibaculum aurantiacum]|uniref:PstS family phosphate ABC transporter substrate-binding protein n=1 Tax=Aridibaculum aurantiacum TaxID=2810307 RepID=UPI001A95AFE2|nr:PstS family phosphate ABC transporter substrate-binding protein [Aridibaculum aurantiacum]
MAFIKALTVFVLVVLLTTGCFKQYNGRISIDGSSSVYPITEAVAEEYRNDHSDIRITVGVSGTGGGFKKFARGETDISNASRPISKSEIEACKKNNIQFIEIPVAYDGLAVVVSPANDFVDYLSVDELKKIWEPAAQEKIKSWKQVRSSFPDVPLRLYGAGTSSGTYDYFTEAIVGKSKSSRGDYTASEDDNVLVQGVSSDKGSLGYFGLAYYEENKQRLRLVPIDNGKERVLPNDSTISNGKYIPLSRPEFIYVNARSAGSQVIKDFIRFYMEQAPALVREIGYVPLQPEAYQLSYERFLKNKQGSMFANRSTVGADLVALLKEGL